MEFFKDENMIYENDHSQFLAKILSIKIYRDIFIKNIGSSLELADSPTIEFEKDAGGNGRIDLIIFDEKQKKALIIENKVNAVDQDKQLQRYSDWANNNKYKFETFYLSPLGSNPAPTSLGNLELSDIGIISYDEHIIPWLNKCIASVQNDHEKLILENYCQQWVDYLNVTYKNQWDKKSLELYDFFKRISEAQNIEIEYVDEPINRSHMYHIAKGKFNLKFSVADRETELIYDAKNEDDLYFRMKKDDFEKLNLRGEWKQSQGHYDCVVCSIDEISNSHTDYSKIIEKIHNALN